MCQFQSYLFFIYFLAHEFKHSFEAQLPGTTQDHLQIFNIEMKAKMKSYQMPEQVRTLFFSISVTFLELF